MDQYYLRSDVKIEPLVFQWPAWPQIIFPATAALNIKNRYLKILESYLSDPEVHFAAANDENLMGGPFVNVSPSHKEKVNKVYLKIKEDASSLLELADAFKNLNLMYII